MIGAVRGRVGEPVRLRGYAYDFGRTVAAVEFSLNEGRTWTRYETPGTNDYQTLTWTFDYTPEQPGTHCLLVRSVNDAGEASGQPARVELLVR